MQQVPKLEQQILGGMLRYNSIIPIGLSLLRRESFQMEANRVVFDAIVSLHQSGKPVDLVHIADHLSVEQVIVQVGGYLQLADIWENSCAQSDFLPLVRLLCNSKGDDQ